VVVPSRTSQTGRPAKRDAVLAGALVVFARDGYTRASIDDIAASASVSTRTIYNHFPDKESLFHSVITDSAAKVADAQIALINEHLADVPADANGLEAALIAFAHAWLAPVAEQRAHFDLVRQVNAELAHIPSEAVHAWRAAGPGRVLAALAARFERFRKVGLLEVEHPGRAALQFAVLIAPTSPSLPLVRAAQRSARENATAGVRLFLRGALPR
jgi:AcrR family transcriptional regulator